MPLASLDHLRCDGPGVKRFGAFGADAPEGCGKRVVDDVPPDTHRPPVGLEERVQRLRPIELGVVREREASQVIAGVVTAFGDGDCRRSILGERAATESPVQLGEPRHLARNTDQPSATAGDRALDRYSSAAGSSAPGATSRKSSAVTLRCAASQTRANPPPPIPLEAG